MPYVLVVLAILIIDRAVKYLVTLNVTLNSDPTTLIPHILGLTNYHNTGAAFSILPNARWLFIVMSLLFTSVVIILLAKNIVRGKLGRWTLVMVMAGGLGNCIDRILNGYVVDMFQFQFMNFAIFNVADIFITICGILFCIYLIFHKEPEEELSKDDAAPAHPLPAGKAHEKRLDYISQIKKPVINGQAGIESEFASRRCENPAAPKSDEGVTDMKSTDFEDIYNKTPLETPVPKQRPQSPVQKKPEMPPIRSDDAVNELFKKPNQPVKKSDTDFSLDDILAEFKDK